MRPSTEAAMWRIAYRLQDSYAAPPSADGIKSSINVEEEIFEDAIESLKAIGIVEQVGSEQGVRYELDEEDWEQAIYKALPRVERADIEDTETYLYRVLFAGQIREDETFGPVTMAELNEKLVAVRTRTPLDIGETLSLEGVEWDVIDILREFAPEERYDGEYHFPYPDYEDPDCRVEDSYGPIVKVARSRSTR